MVHILHIGKASQKSEERFLYADSQIKIEMHTWTPGPKNIDGLNQNIIRNIQESHKSKIKKEKPEKDQIDR